MTDPLSDVDVPLSPAGLRRRDAILRLALDEARRGRRRRRVAQRTFIAAVIFAVSAVVSIDRLRRPTNDRPVARHAPAPSPVKPAPVITGGEVTVVEIRTDPTLADRLALPRQAATWRLISDDELLDALGRAGQPAALAFDNGRPNLLFRDVRHDHLW
jgi:hypothetical protein